MNGNVLTGVNDMVKDFMKATKEGLKEIQDGPVGMEQRSKREMSIMMKKLQEMPHEERQIKMQEMANVAGHKGDKFDDCSLCKFVTSKMK